MGIGSGGYGASQSIDREILERDLRDPSPCRRVDR